MPWSEKFEDPIKLPDGTVIKTLKQARDAIPSDHPAQVTLARAAEHRAFLFFARIAAAKALMGETPPPNDAVKRVKKADQFRENRKAWIAAGRPKPK